MIALRWAPSKAMEAPVTKLARSDARKVTISATSSARAMRPMGMLLLVSARASAAVNPSRAAIPASKPSQRWVSTGPRVHTVHGDPLRGQLLG